MINKKIINLGILLVFIFSCNINTSSSNVIVDIETPTSSTLNNSTIIQSPSSEIKVSTTPTSTSLPYTGNIENTRNYFNLNEGNDGVQNGYDGKVLIIVDTHLLSELIKNEKTLELFPRKVMILKDSYDELNEGEKIQLKKEYGDYTIFDRDNYIPIKEGRRRDSTYDGIVNFNFLGLNVNDKEVLYYNKLSYIAKEDSNKTPYIFLNPNFSEKINLLHENVKKSNKRKLMKAPIKKIILNSIYALSQFSEFMYYSVNYTNVLRFTSISTIPEVLPLKSYTWNNCIPNYCD